MKNTAGTTVESYTYDGAGNILSATKNGTTNTYTYGDANGWADLLTAYNGSAITYDGVGNPLSYRGWTFSWGNGRQLEQITNASNTFSYTYNADGMRVSKNLNGSETQFTYQGTQLVQSDHGGDILEFIYDSEGNPYGVRYIYTVMDGSVTDTMYYYLLNQQGDVEALIDSAGNIACRYTYDAWGDVKSVTNAAGAAITESTHIANVNPLRYRGYYYDTETGSTTLVSTPSAALSSRTLKKNVPVIEKYDGPIDNVWPKGLI